MHQYLFSLRETGRQTQTQSALWRAAAPEATLLEESKQRDGAQMSGDLSLTVDASSWPQTRRKQTTSSASSR